MRLTGSPHFNPIVVSAAAVVGRGRVSGCYVATVRVVTSVNK